LLHFPLGISQTILTEYFQKNQSEVVIVAFQLLVGVRDYSFCTFISKLAEEHRWKKSRQVLVKLLLSEDL